MKIINPLISSARPQINNMLQQGMELNLTSFKPLKKLNVTGLVGATFLDYASFGVRFDLWSMIVYINFIVYFDLVNFAF